MRIKRSHLLYHGTILYEFDLERAERLLATPTRTPEYRQNRSHRDFIANLPLDRPTTESLLKKAWGADENLVDWPRERTAELAQKKYERL